MKLVRVGDPGDERPGILHDGVVTLLESLTHDYDSAFWSSDFSRRLSEWSDRRDSLPQIPEGEIRFGPPIPRPEKVVCVGLNYVDHVEESGAEVPTEPVLFMKPPNTVVGPNDNLLIPPGSTATDWEVELAIVIGKRCRYLQSLEDAIDSIAGYAISNDVSERFNQLERGGQWVKGKGSESFNPLGPWLVTPDELDLDRGLAMSLTVNGEQRQKSNTRHMIFSPAEIVRYTSHFMVLEPGDVVNTGTPSGVALGANDYQYLAAGDVVEVEIEGLGQQRQVCINAVI